MRVDCTPWSGRDLPLYPPGDLGWRCQTCFGGPVDSWDYWRLLVNHYCRFLAYGRVIYIPERHRIYFMLMLVAICLNVTDNICAPTPPPKGNRLGLFDLATDQLRVTCLFGPKKFRLVWASQVDMFGAWKGDRGWEKKRPGIISCIKAA